MSGPEDNHGSVMAQLRDAFRSGQDSKTEAALQSVSRLIVGAIMQATHWEEMYGFQIDQLRRLTGGRNFPIPEWDSEVAVILGRPNFACGSMAEMLRGMGIEIPRESQQEQARVCYWLLCIYAEHGPSWKSVVNSIVDAENAKGNTGCQTLSKTPSTN